MSLMNAAMKAKLAKAKQVGPDMNEAKQGGGGYAPPAEGKGVRLRLVGYYELGTHVEQSGKFAGKKNRKVRLVWELSGRLWEPKEHEGKKIPFRISDDLNYSLNEKAAFYKLFARLNEYHGGEATIMAELLGKEFIGDVKHNKSGDKVYANIENIRKAERENDEGEIVPVKVDDAISELKFFIWDIADIEMWDSIFIDGEYEERKDKDGNVIAKARSKNTLQEKIRSALDWDECPIAALVGAGATAQDEADLDEALGSDDNEHDIEEDSASGTGEPDLSMV